MAASEGGGANVQCNLPLPKINEVYYWEAKLYEKPESTVVAIGLATKPYPSFRLPGALGSLPMHGELNVGRLESIFCWLLLDRRLQIPQLSLHGLLLRSTSSRG
jgi:hypothetical protein